MKASVIPLLMPSRVTATFTCHQQQGPYWHQTGEKHNSKSCPRAPLSRVISGPSSLSLAALEHGAWGECLYVAASPENASPGVKEERKEPGKQGEPTQGTSLSRLPPGFRQTRSWSCWILRVCQLLCFRTVRGMEGRMKGGSFFCQLPFPFVLSLTLCDFL